MKIDTFYLKTRSIFILITYIPNTGKLLPFSIKMLSYN